MVCQPCAFHPLHRSRHNTRTSEGFGRLWRTEQCQGCCTRGGSRSPLPNGLALLPVPCAHGSPAAWSWGDGEPPSPPSPAPRQPPSSSPQLHGCLPAGVIGCLGNKLRREISVGKEKKGAQGGSSQTGHAKEDLIPVLVKPKRGYSKWVGGWSQPLPFWGHQKGKRTKLHE